MAEISKFIGDKTAQEEGTWIPFQDGIEFKLIYSEKGRPQRFFLNGYTKLRQKRHGKIPKSDDQEKLATEMLIDFVVKDWKGLEHRDSEGKLVEFPYSRDNCRKLLDDSPVIKQFVMREAANGDNFGMQLDDEDLGDDAPEGTAHGDLKSVAPVET